MVAGLYTTFHYTRYLGKGQSTCVMDSRSGSDFRRAMLSVRRRLGGIEARAPFTRIRRTIEVRGDVRGNQTAIRPLRKMFEVFGVQIAEHGLLSTIAVCAA